MNKKRDSCQEAARRAWRLLRLKCRLVTELRLMPKYLKCQHKKSRDIIHYGERELSFDETPIKHHRMSRPASLRFMIPCITPKVTNFDYDFDKDRTTQYGSIDDDFSRYGYDYDDVRFGDYGAQRSFLASNGEDCEEGMVYGDAGIDVRAEEFIAKFYQQMKMQRQISYQQRCNVIQAV